MRSRALLALLVIAPLAAGCGGGGHKAPKDPTPKGSPDAAAKRAAQDYLDAYVAKDPHAICSALTAKVRKQLADNKGTCVKTVRGSLKGSYRKLQVKQAYSNGDSAAATIVGSLRQVQMVREDASWKVFNGGS